MEIRLNDDAKKDLLFWKNTNNLKVHERIKQLLISISETPFSGIGKPEPLKSTTCQDFGQEELTEKIE
jgi:toxin YoeB